MGYVYKVNFIKRLGDKVKTTVAKNEYELEKILSGLILAHQTCCTKIFEKWAKIPGYYNRYEISNFGRIKSVIDGKNLIISQSKNKSGYNIVCLYDLMGTKRTEKVHRLVCMTFNPNPKNLPEVDHITQNKECNYSFALRWASRLENAFRKPIIATNGKDSEMIFNSAKEAEELGFNSSHISSCCTGKRNSHKGFKWSFLNV